MNLILCGLPRSGKTTLGEMWAKQRGWAFQDIDRELEREHGASRSELFKKWGEEQYRLLEQKVIARLAPLKPTVIALGGGSLNLVENVRILKTIGTLIYLNIPYPILLERIKLDPPVYMQNIEEDLKKLMENRCPLFESVADQIYTYGE